MNSPMLKHYDGRLRELQDKMQTADVNDTYALYNFVGNLADILRDVIVHLDGKLPPDPPPDADDGGG